MHTAYTFAYTHTYTYTFTYASKRVPCLAEWCERLEKQGRCLVTVGHVLATEHCVLNICVSVQPYEQNCVLLGGFDLS